MGILKQKKPVGRPTKQETATLSLRVLATTKAKLQRKYGKGLNKKVNPYLNKLVK